MLRNIPFFVSVTNSFSLILHNLVNLFSFLLIFRHYKHILATQSYTAFCYIIYNSNALYIILEFAEIKVELPGNSRLSHPICVNFQNLKY